MNRLKTEENRIKDVYAARDASGKSALYAWHRQEVLYISYRQRATWAKALYNAGFNNFTNCEILDLGCGAGGWLRMMMEWGGATSLFHGVDMLEDRISKAKAMSPSEIDFRVSNSWPLPYPEDSFDLCATSTVFSSILDANARKSLAREMERILKPKGAIMIFDFAISDPRNPDTIGIGRREIGKLFPNLKLDEIYRLILAPPLLRKIPASLLWLAHALEVFLPFLCTHRLYVLKSNC